MSNYINIGDIELIFHDHFPARILLNLFRRGAPV